MSATTSRLFQYSKCDPMLMPRILLLTRVILKSFQKKKEDSSLYHASLFGHSLLHFVMLLLTYSALRTIILSFTTHSPRFGDKKWNLLFICHYSLSLFTCYYSWHFSLRIFAYLRGVVPYIWSNFLVCLVQDFFPRQSYPLRAFLWDISLLTRTSLHLYYPYKACN